MSQINTLIKPTHNCNLRCNYCFHEKYGYEKKLLDMNKLKKYIDLLSENYKYINLVWHGGEALTVSLDYYEEIYNYCDSKNSKFMFSVQTNGTLLTPKIVNFFNRTNTNIGLSFDGLNNELMRRHTYETLEGIKLLQKNNYNPGAIIVINQNNVKNLINEVTYSANDYINEIDNKIYSITNVEDNLDKAYIEVNKLKEEFKRNFLCYNLDEYDKSYKKILLIEGCIIKNKEKIDNIKKNLNSTKKTNKEILTRVKKLNSQKKTLQ